MEKKKSSVLAILLVIFMCSMGLNAQAQPQSANEIEISNFSFQPNMLTVPAGTEVTWNNRDPAFHTVTSDDGSFDSDDIMSGGRFSHTFDQPGSYSYHCKVHPSMQGMIQVIETSAAGTPSTPGAYAAAQVQPQGALSQYAQYYQMNAGPAPRTSISAPQQYSISGREPSSLYVSGQMQAVPFSQYQAYATYTGGNSLWIQGTTSWTQYAAVPQGAFLSLVAASPAGGNGFLYEIRPDGNLIKNSYNFYPYNSIGFYADTVGQHVLLFAIGDQTSNAILIDVVAGYPQGYQQQFSVQPGYQQPSGYQQPGYQPQPGYGQPSYQPSGGY